MSQSSAISARKLALFYLPIAANTGLMMLSHVINNAGLSRTADASYVLAGYALARNLAMFTEAPVLMMRQTAISFVRNRRDLRLLLGYVVRLSLVLCVLTMLVSLTPLGEFILRFFLHAPTYLQRDALQAFLLFALLPLVSAVRSVYQGVLLYQRQPGVITLAMAARAVVMGFTVAGLTRFLPQLGASIGTLTFMAGLAVETIISYAFAHSTPIARAEPAPAHQTLDVSAIVAFSAPLVVLGLVEGVANGAITASLARGHQPDLTIAAFTVTWSVVAVLTGALQSVHQLIMVFGHEPGVKTATKRFVCGIAAISAALLAVPAFIPAGRRLFTQSLGLTADLGVDALQTLQWFVPLPIAVIVADTLVGRLLILKRSRMVAAAKVANMGVLAFIALVLARGNHTAGPVTGPAMMLAATCVETVVLFGCLSSLKPGGDGDTPDVDDAASAA